MNRASIRVLIVITMAVTLTCVITLRAQNNAARPAIIAVMDAMKVLNSLDEKSAADADINRLREDYQKETQQRRQDITDLENDLSILASDSDAYRQAMEQREMKAIELDSWQKFQRLKIERERAIRYERLYLNIVDAAEKIAQRNGYDLVLYKDTAEDIRSENLQQLSQQIALRKVLYSRPDMDITDQITQILNNEFNNRQQ